MNGTSCIGIDLGTTNCAIALANESGSELIEVLQLIDAGVVARQAVLPSATYLPLPDEFAPSQLRTGVPGADSVSRILGQFARELSSLNPARSITSAKSWLCQSSIERTAPILPWGTGANNQKLSPVDVSVGYLKHLLAMSADARGISQDDIHSWPTVITVPASFDEVARSLTTRAAIAAGIAEPVLLEEPLAAFYAWLFRHSDKWREMLKPGDVVLVCDVGGGTADFTIVAVTEESGELALERVSVGEHILLGGDNMDLALAETIRMQLEDQGRLLDDWQFRALIERSRDAKEELLGERQRDTVTVGIAGKGANLFRSAISIDVNRQLVEEIVLQGFFPQVERSASPAGRQAGLREIGLNYAADPSITRYLAAFLRRSATIVRSESRFSSLTDQVVEISGPLPTHDAEMLLPTAVLFNGGVFRSALLRNAILQQLTFWSAGRVPDELGPAGSDNPANYYQEASYDGACAIGAAYYGQLLRNNTRLKVRAGLPRSYFLGIEKAGLAVPGARPRLKGLCVAPRGVEEGSELEIAGQEFLLTTGERVSFRFFGTANNAPVRLGEMIENPEGSLSEYGVAEVCLPTNGDGTASEVVRVSLVSRITTLGTLELWMRERGGDGGAGEREWRVEFDTRGV